MGHVDNLVWMNFQISQNILKMRLVFVSGGLCWLESNFQFYFIPKKSSFSSHQPQNADQTGRLGQYKSPPLEAAFYTKKVIKFFVTSTTEWWPNRKAQQVLFTPSLSSFFIPRTCQVFHQINHIVLTKQEDSISMIHPLFKLPFYPKMYICSSH